MGSPRFNQSRDRGIPYQHQVIIGSFQRTELKYNELEQAWRDYESSDENIRNEKHERIADPTSDDVCGNHYCYFTNYSSIIYEHDHDGWIQNGVFQINPISPRVAEREVKRMQYSGASWCFDGYGCHPDHGVGSKAVPHPNACQNGGSN